MVDRNEGEWIMQMTALDEAWGNGYASVRQGILDAKVLLEGDEGRPDMYKLVLIGTDTDYNVVRHRHTFDQVRYTIRGEFGYGNGGTVPAGHVSYFPEGVYYGPQSRAPGTLMVICQFGGASGQGYQSRTARQAAIAAMSREGAFDGGIYTYVDADGKRHNQDAFEAVSERVAGGKLSYPKPRYSDVITMNPANFAWVEDAAAPGVAAKRLGTFTERDVGIGFIRLAAGATLRAGCRTAPELFFVAAGTVRCADKTLPLYSAFSFAAGEGPVPVRAAEAAELLCLRMPAFAD